MTRDVGSVPWYGVKAVKDMTIGALARRGDVGVETVRYYQRRGLMRTPGPGGDGKVRVYDAEDLKRLRFIRAAKGAGFTLNQIAELTGLDAEADRGRVLALTRDRLSELDARIAELRAVRRALKALADECGAGGAGPCPIVSRFEGG